MESNLQAPFVVQLICHWKTKYQMKDVKSVENIVKSECKKVTLVFCLET